MIPIHIPNLNEIIEEFYQAVKAFSESKTWFDTVNNWLVGKGYTLEQVVKAKPYELAILIRELPKVGTPQEFKKIYSEFSNSSKGLKYINTNGDRIVYSGIDLIERLGINVCPYCNRTYVQSIKNKNQYHKKRRTCEFDHFYPQSEYPFLAISFYNLIPSCKTCNHIKGKNPIQFSPYEINGESLVEFKYKIEGIDYLTDPKQVSIEIDWKNQEFYESNGKVFGLDDLYKNHNDIAQEILLKRHIYNDSRIDELLEEYEGLFSSKEEIIQMIAGNYINEEDLGKRPLSKLTRDIAREVKFIK
ncbi:HNH endonuclease [Marinifilum sp. D714]|uniref:HNH endonuclease n=1 Tax=Marinifilum sp. D714 TaxID=2937523 RepID=UPI0027C00565|nr:hypothetical protein [Marinifilum sp. D714]MDQ2178392.1 hypothetical protein [Marinifilum sp. D714]